MKPVALLLAVAGAAMLVAAFAGGTDGDDGDDKATAARAVATTAPSQALDPGLRVWIEQGCGSCHAFRAASAKGRIAPNFDETLPGRSRDYVLRSIVAPASETTPGWDAGMMPDDFAQRMTPQELQDLVSFIVAGVRERPQS